MADYYPLIARAVAGLEKNTGDARRSLYERARSALVAQLRGVSPALNESDVTRERLALEEAIRKVEGEAARQTRVDSGRSEHKIKPPEFPRWEEPAPAPSAGPPPSSLQPRRAAAQPLRGNSGGLARPAAAPPPPMLGESRYVDPVFDQPLETPGESTAQALRGGRARQVNNRSVLDAGLKDFRDVVSEANELGEATARSAKSARDMSGRDVTARDLTAREILPREFPSREISPREMSPREIAPREIAPREIAPRQYSGREIAPREAFAPVPAAPRDYDRPRQPMPELQELDAPVDEFHEQDLLESNYASEEEHQMVPQPSRRGGRSRALDSEGQPPRSYADLIKIGVALAGIAAVAGIIVWQWPNMAALYRAMRTPSVEVVKEQPPGRSKIPDRIEPGGQTSAPPATTTPNVPGAAVAQRVVLYEEDPAEPQGRQFVGSAVWRTETVSPGPRQSPELAIRADVTVPDKQLSIAWVLRRNTDKSLPASHTIEITFKLPNDFASGGVDNIPGILMKSAEQTRGIPLAGSSAKVTKDYFLIGLSSLEADKDRNIQLLKERDWIDIPIVYTNRRRAILAIDKGTAGDRVFEQAFASWK